MFTYFRNNQSSVPAPSTAEQPNPEQLVQEFERTLQSALAKNSLNDLWPLFLSDNRAEDIVYREKIISAYPNREELSWQLTDYKILDTRQDRNEAEYQITIEETRDYADKTTDYGRIFTRIIVLAQNGNGWGVKEYRKIPAGNNYSGSLSGSVKYSGFYP
ncbi:MAG: hypothetical protein Q8P73_02260 [bacterium]|nr:hypothetical protein [bacterium]